MADSSLPLREKALASTTNVVPSDVEQREVPTMKASKGPGYSLVSIYTQITEFEVWTAMC